MKNIFGSLGYCVANRVPGGVLRSAYWKLCILMVVILAIAFGCSSHTPSPDTETRVSFPESWPISSPEEQGIDSALLAEMLKSIDKAEYRIDAIVIIRNGHKVLDASIYPFKAGERHVIYSCTKSVVSALIGIAIEGGYIEGLDQPILEVFSDHNFANLDADKVSMTLEDVLILCYGLDCQDSYLYNWKGLIEMQESDDWVQYVLDLPMIAPPGEKFEYCNGASFLLSAIIQETTGKTAREFAEAHLFRPLGITDVEWETNPQGYNLGYSGLDMLPQDMAKFGYLYLHQGQWGDQQIVPAEWVEASTRKYIGGTLQPGYGYQWWVTTYGATMALGYQGQYIIVMPELDLVVVFVSELPDQQFYLPENLLRTYIIPAVQSTESLPENPEGTSELQAQIQALTAP